MTKNTGWQKLTKNAPTIMPKMAARAWELFTVCAEWIEKILILHYQQTNGDGTWYMLPRYRINSFCFCLAQRPSQIMTVTKYFCYYCRIFSLLIPLALDILQLKLTALFYIRKSRCLRFSYHLSPCRWLQVDCQSYQQLFIFTN